MRRSHETDELPMFFTIILSFYMYFLSKINIAFKLGLKIYGLLQKLKKEKLQSTSMSDLVRQTEVLRSCLMHLRLRNYRVPFAC